MPLVPRIVVLALLLVSYLAPSFAAVAQENGASSVSSDPLYAPIVDSMEDDLLARTEDIARYTIEAELDEATEVSNATITGTLELDYLNHTGDDLDEIPFRLYGNSEEYAEGQQSIREVEADGAPVDVTEGQSGTLATIELPDPLAEGDRIVISMEFETLLPTDPLLSYGMFKYDSDTNTYSLAHWIPLLAGWDEVYDWNIGPISLNGDPVYTEAAVFDVTLSAPEDIVVVTSGSALEEDLEDGVRTVRYSSGPSRDFVMAASADFEMIEEQSGETTVRSWYWPGSEEGAENVLDQGVYSMNLYSDLIGPYPYEEMDLVQMDIGNGAGGVEFPGLMYIGSGFYNERSGSGSPAFLEFIVVHEVAHQWFYNIIGNNQYQHAFIDEAMANYLSIVYFADRYGTEAANEQANWQIRLGYFDMLFKEGDQIVDQPTDDFPTPRDYGIIIYGKGALGFQYLRREIGTDPFFDGLKQYYDDFSFAVAQPDDLKAAFEDASGEDLDEFWTHWFEMPNGEDDFDAADLARLLREINGEE